MTTVFNLTEVEGLEPPSLEGSRFSKPFRHHLRDTSSRVSNRVRTDNSRLHNLELYQLSYRHRANGNAIRTFTEMTRGVSTGDPGSVLWAYRRHPEHPSL